MSLFWLDVDSNPFKCGADEHRRRGLDRAEPLFSFASCERKCKSNPPSPTKKSTCKNKSIFYPLRSDVLPTTSQATPDAFMKEFEKAKETGEAAVVITLASKFSGTYQSATNASYTECLCFLYSTPRCSG